MYCIYDLMSNLPTPAFMFKWIRSLLGCRCRHRDGGGLEEPEPEEALTQSSEASRSPSSNNSEDSSYSVPEQPESAQLPVLATTSALGRAADRRSKCFCDPLRWPTIGVPSVDTQSIRLESSRTTSLFCLVNSWLG